MRMFDFSQKRMSDNTRLHVLFISLQEDRNGISSKFQLKCKQDIKMQIADTTIDNFPNISSESMSALFVKEMCVCGASPWSSRDKRAWG